MKENIRWLWVIFGLPLSIATTYSTNKTIALYVLILILIFIEVVFWLLKQILMKDKSILYIN
jgi:hypothetical protein